VQRDSGTSAGSAGSRWLAIGLTSIAFSLMHLSALPEASRGAALVTLAAVSILLGWLYERSGRLWAPIAAHGLFNAINLAIALLPA
jgi:membrane protease YdiL (CAAX protease family)